MLVCIAGRHDALFVVGSLDETVMLRGMRYHPIDIETSVLRCHRKICEWLDILPISFSQANGVFLFCALKTTLMIIPPSLYKNISAWMSSLSWHYLRLLYNAFTGTMIWHYAY